MLQFSLKQTHNITLYLCFIELRDFVFVNGDYYYYYYYLFEMKSMDITMYEYCYCDVWILLYFGKKNKMNVFELFFLLILGNCKNYFFLNMLSIDICIYPRIPQSKSIKCLLNGYSCGYKKGMDIIFIQWNGYGCHTICVYGYPFNFC